MKKERRDAEGRIKDSLVTRAKSWWLGKKLRQGKIPRGRTITSDEAAKAMAVGAPRYGIEGFGLLSARVIRSGGDIQDLGLISVKKITTAFRDALVDSLQGAFANWGNFKYHGSGTGVAAESNTDTTLGTEVESRATGTQIEGASANIYKSVGTVSYTATRAITEHGLFSASSAGTLMDRSVFSAINVVNGDSIQFTYEATFNAET